VRLVPFDPHLETGAEISLEQLNRKTREALIELAAVVADGFSGPDRHGLFVTETGSTWKRHRRVP
jgi:MinD-like ATPase involved in chromosome partitioning or flagellar assembly